MLDQNKGKTDVEMERVNENNLKWDSDNQDFENSFDNEDAQSNQSILNSMFPPKEREERHTGQRKHKTERT